MLLCLLSPLSVSAQDFPSGWPSAPEISSASGVLMEASSGQVLFDKSMNEIRYPASTTKVMTALIILENIPDLNKNITFTDIILPDLAPGNSTINAQIGEVLTVEQCLYAIMLASANEVCTQMAVEVAGSVENFTAMMNAKAAEIGCTNTHFVNANGLPDPNHYTTAYDLALILREAVKMKLSVKSQELPNILFLLRIKLLPPEIWKIIMRFWLTENIITKELLQVKPDIQKQPETL